MYNHKMDLDPFDAEQYLARQEIIMGRDGDRQIVWKPRENKYVITIGEDSITIGDTVPESDRLIVAVNVYNRGWIE